MAILRKNQAYTLASDGDYVLIKCSETDRSKKFLEVLRKKGIDTSSMVKKVPDQDWKSTLDYLIDDAYVSKHFTTLCNRLYGANSNKRFCVCFADMKAVGQTMSLHTEAFTGAKALVEKPMAEDPRWLLVCGRRTPMFRHRLSTTRPWEGLLPSPEEISQCEHFMNYVNGILPPDGYPFCHKDYLFCFLRDERYPVAKSKIIHFLILSMVVLIKWYDKYKHSDGTLPTRRKVDRWVLQQIDRFLIEEKQLLKRNNITY